MTGAPLLEVAGLTMRFGGLTAVDDAAFTAQAGQITAVIGPNGAGKTTVFNCLTGFYRPSAGRITLTTAEGRSFRLDRMADFRIARTARVARTFQNVRLFPGMTVLENLLVARHATLQRASVFSLAGLANTAAWRRSERAAIDRAAQWLDRIGLAARADQPAADLPYGDQRRLEIARAMCLEPRLLCLDEPAAGLNPRESADLRGLLATIRDRDGTAILLIEHDMSVVMGVSDHVVVLDHGRKICEGPPDHVRGDPDVVRAYLGEPEPVEQG